MRMTLVRLARALVVLGALAVVLVVAEPAEAAAPGTPAAPVATISGRTVTLSWTPPDADGGSPITGYQVRPLWGGTGLPVRTFTSTATTQVLTDLPADDDLTFRVAAVNADGPGPWSWYSNEVSWTSTVPSPPTGLTVTRTGYATEVKLAFTPPADTGGAPITGYKVTPWKDGVAQTTGIGGLNTTVDVTSLVPGATYTLTVTAYNKRGASAPSAHTAAFVADTTPGLPGSPQAVSSTAGDAKAYLSWYAPAQTGGAPLLGYVITPYLGNTAQPVQTTTGTATSATVTGLANDKGYSFTVAARNVVGTGPASARFATVYPMSVWKPFATPEQFVDRQYADLLNRPPTSSERASWVAKLRSGDSGGRLARALRDSSDHTSNIDPVTRLYFAYNLRLPDPGGLEYWIAKKRGGRSLSTISNSFAASSEFKTRYGAMTNRAFVERIYVSVMERPADPSGVAYWTKQLDTKKKNRGQVMIGFSESGEYQRGNANEVEICVLYARLLGKMPSILQFNALADSMDRGDLDDWEVARDIYRTPAYEARVT